MAASRLCGYQCEFLESVNDLFYCKMCVLVARKVTITTCCGESFCHDCITSINQQLKPCPECGKKEFVVLNQLKYRQRIGALKVYCSMKESGCVWSGTVDLLDTHLNNCQYVDTKCPLNCLQTVPKNKVDHHVAQECSKRPHVCQHCGYKATYQEVVAAHLPECKYVAVQCPNFCGVTCEREDMKDHMKICRLEEVSCVFSGLGCSEKFPRENEDSHISGNIMQHLFLVAAACVKTKELSQKIKDQEQQLHEQSKELQALRKKIQTLEQKLGDYERNEIKVGELSDRMIFQEERVFKIFDRVMRLERSRPFNIKISSCESFLRNKQSWNSPVFDTDVNGPKFTIIFEAVDFSDATNNSNTRLGRNFSFDPPRSGGNLFSSGKSFSQEFNAKPLSKHLSTVPPQSLGPSRTIPPRSLGSSLGRVPPQSLGPSSTVPPQSLGPSSTVLPQMLGSSLGRVPPQSLGPSSTVLPQSLGSSLGRVPPQSLGPSSTVPPQSLGPSSTVPPQSLGSSLGRVPPQSFTVSTPSLGSSLGRVLPQSLKSSSTAPLSSLGSSLGTVPIPSLRSSSTTPFSLGPSLGTVPRSGLCLGPALGTTPLPSLRLSTSLGPGGTKVDATFGDCRGNKLDLGEGNKIGIGGGTKLGTGGRTVLSFGGVSQLDGVSKPSLAFGRAVPHGNVSNTRSGVLNLKSHPIHPATSSDFVRSDFLLVNTRAVQSEYDDNLKWPIEADVTIEIVNPTGGEHKSCTITKSWSKPGGLCIPGDSVPFIAVSELGQFCRGDFITFQITNIKLQEAKYSPKNFSLMGNAATPIDF